ncbi:ribonuclease-like [Pelodiscus sinensis]|uniref:ribonuclease-like n=1 Tax=Pelodiscus sinensis TaxID=13735 RepID=UPI003F6D72F5
MAPGGPCPALLLLLVLLPAGLAYLSAFRSSQELVWKHVDFPRTSPPPGQPYCDHLMWKRRSRIRGCRRSFTFVHAEPIQLYSLCRCYGRCQPMNRTSVSRNPVPTTTCRMVPGLGRCSYVGRFERCRIRVACSSWKPVDVLGTV